MLLKRYILIEKILDFKRYNSPYEVPDCTWEKVHSEIYNVGFYMANCDKVFETYAEKILIPLSKIENYELSETKYNPNTFMPYWVIRTNGTNIFEIGLDLLVDAKEATGFQMLKELTLFIWDRKYTLEQQ